MIGIGLIFISLVAGVIFLAYWVPKRIGYPKTGKYISIILTLSIVIIAALTVFEDDLFSKSDVQKLLIEQGIQISDNFDIEENKSMFSPGDYYHTFTLSITSKDKERIISEIKASLNFNKGEPVESYFDNRTDYYTGPKRIKNYETEDQYIREFFEPQGEGYAPTWRKIKIEKKKNKLIFEDIDD
jgi:hypothetical protein